MIAALRGCSSVGRVLASQARCRGFEPRHPLFPSPLPHSRRLGSFFRTLLTIVLLRRVKLVAPLGTSIFDASMKLRIILPTLLIVILGFAQADEIDFGLRIVSAARQQLGVTKGYDPTYAKLKYPGGDVPLSTGVCSDVVIRALRSLGLDLQREVHRDMEKNFSEYPQKWGLKAPDSNIDHRRVLNLMRYFERHHFALAKDLQVPDSYKPGDIVSWDLGGGVTHIGIVSDQSPDGTPLIIHNIGRGVKEEDILFEYEVIGHYRLKESGETG